jgi:hypothetical protein
MLTPAELRDQSRVYRDASVKEAAPEFKRRLASHALALAQLAERIERALRAGEGVEELRLTVETLLGKQLGPSGS